MGKTAKDNKYVSEKKIKKVGKVAPKTAKKKKSNDDFDDDEMVELEDMTFLQDDYYDN